MTEAQVRFQDMNGVQIDVPETVLNDHLAKKMARSAYEESEARAVQMRVKPGDRVLELGGGIGYISALCAKITNPSGILTVEANPMTVDIVRHNLALNAAQDATVLHAAVVANDKGTDMVAFRSGRVFWGSSLATPEDQKRIVEVESCKITDLLESHRPDVVIMDIEGGEAGLFDAPWPAFVRNVIVELHPKKYPRTAIKRIVDCMSESGLTYDPGCSRGALIGFRRV